MSAQTSPPSRHPPRTDTPPPSKTATAADGTHPTGMHSCIHNDYRPQTRLREGNVVTGDCPSAILSTWAGGGGLHHIYHGIGHMVGNPSPPPDTRPGHRPPASEIRSGHIPRPPPVHQTWAPTLILTYGSSLETCSNFFT